MGYSLMKFRPKRLIIVEKLWQESPAALLVSYWLDNFSSSNAVTSGDTAKNVPDESLLLFLHS